MDAAFYVDVTRMAVRATAEVMASRKFEALEYPSSCTPSSLSSQLLQLRMNYTLMKTLQDVSCLTLCDPQRPRLELSLEPRESQKGCQSLVLVCVLV